MKGMIVALLLGAGCGATATDTKREPPRRIVSSSIDGFDRSDLVAFADGRAVFYAIGDDKLEELGRTEIGHSGVWDADWMGRDEVFVNGADHEVLRLTAKGVTALAAPPLADFKVKAPSDDDELERVDWERLAVDDSGAWWGYCPYGSTGDWSCQKWSWIRVDQDAEQKAGGEKGRTWKFPDEAPAGFKLVQKKIDDQFDTLTCTDPDGKETVFNPSRDGWGNSVVAHHWVSADPPALLVEIGYGGDYYAGQVSHWELLKGCDKQIASGTTVEPGPGNLWVGNQGEYEENAHPSVFRGGKRVGALRHGIQIRFRPPST